MSSEYRQFDHKKYFDWLESPDGKEAQRVIAENSKELLEQFAKAGAVP